MKKILFLYVSTFGAASVLGQPLDMNLLKARACMDQNKIDSALTILKPLQTTPKNFLVNLWIGDCYYQKADFNMANRYYLMADSLSNGSASFELSRTYARLNDKSQTIAWLQKYLALPDKKSELEVRMDSAFKLTSTTQEWRTVWDKDWYSGSETERNAINALLDKGKTSGAMAELENNEGKFSPRHEYFFLQAKIYEKQHLPALALTAVEKAISLYSFSDEYLSFYANLLKNNKKYGDALGNITKAIRLNPYHAVYYLKRGEIARLAGDYQLAEKDLKMYRELYPDVPETYHQLGLLESSRGNNQNAMGFYDILLAKDKANAYYFLERGSLALSMDQIQKADEDFSLALDLNPNLQEAYLKKGNTSLILNDTSGACFYWGEARRLGSSEAAKLIYKNCKE